MREISNDLKIGGRETLKKYFTGIRTAFPDPELPIIRMVAERDHVAVLNRVKGTHIDDFQSVTLTGNRIDVMPFSYIASKMKNWPSTGKLLTSQR